jgi:hypothetical protein
LLYIGAEGLPKPITAATQNKQRALTSGASGETVWVHWPVEAGVLLER